MTTHDVLEDLDTARAEFDRLHETTMQDELARIQQQLVELRAELGLPPPIRDYDEDEDEDEDEDTDSSEDEADEGAVPPPPIDVVRPQVAGHVSDGPRGLRVLGAGVGGFEELAESLVEDAVQFGVLRFELGSGSFMREKFVFLQYAGPQTGAVKRGRHVGQAAIVKEAMGGAHASMVFYDRIEMTTDNVLQRLLSIMTADDGDFDLDQLKAMIDAQIAKAAAAADVVGDGGRHVLTAAEMRHHGGLPPSLPPLFLPPALPASCRAVPPILLLCYRSTILLYVNVQRCLSLGSACADFGAVECIRYVKAAAGAFNWLLLEPDATNLTRESETLR